MTPDFFSTSRFSRFNPLDQGKPIPCWGIPQMLINKINKINSLLQQLLTAPAGLCQNDVSAWVAPAIFRFATQNQLILIFDLFFSLSVFVLHWFRIRLLIFYLLGYPLD